LFVIFIFYAFFKWNFRNNKIVPIFFLFTGNDRFEDNEKVSSKKKNRKKEKEKGFQE
jgi:hypothetical protein